MYLPLSGELNDSVKLAHQSPGSLPHLNVLAVGQAGGCGRGAQLGLGTSLGLLQGQQLSGGRADQQRLRPG